MSVDTYLKGKNLSPYNVLQHGELKILIAPGLIRWAETVQLNTKRFLFWESFNVEAQHRHGATCAH